MRQHSQDLEWCFECGQHLIDVSNNFYDQALVWLHPLKCFSQQVSYEKPTHTLRAPEDDSFHWSLSSKEVTPTVHIRSLALPSHLTLGKVLCLCWPVSSSIKFSSPSVVMKVKWDTRCVAESNNVQKAISLSSYSVTNLNLHMSFHGRKKRILHTHPCVWEGRSEWRAVPPESAEAMSPENIL